VVTDRDRDNSDMIQIDTKTTENLTDKILLRKEIETAKALFTTTAFGNNASATTATSWSYNTTTSAPIQNVMSGTSVIVKNSGKKPNTMIMGDALYDALKNNTNVYSRIQYVERAIMTKELLAAVFDIERVEVGYAAYDESREGQTESITSIWGGNALLAYMSPRGGMKELSAALMLEINGQYKTKKWREEAVSGDIIEVSSMFVPKLVATQCGYYFSDFSIA